LIFWLIAVGAGVNIGAVNSEDFTEIFQMLFENVYGVKQDVFNKVRVFGEFLYESGISGFVRNGVEADAGGLAKQGIALESANQLSDRAEIEGITGKIAVPESLYVVALTTSVYLALERIKKFLVIKGFKHSTKFENIWIVMLPGRAADLIIEGSHRDTNTILPGRASLRACGA
jgi:hypothetical protein